MDNLKRLAFPQSIALSDDNSVAQTSWGVHEDFAGFTKLEYAALMIAAGMSQGIYSDGLTDKQSHHIVQSSVFLAKAVLEEANK